MPNLKISALPALPSALGTDLLAIVDTSAPPLVTKRITVANLAPAVLTALGGSVSVNFGAGNTSSIVLSVADPLVQATTRILPFVLPGPGRDLDEMESAPVIASAGDVVAGVGFKLIVVSLDATADGIYTVNYLRT
jgi:hypothetical protein